MRERGRLIQRADDRFKQNLLLGSSSLTGTEEPPHPQSHPHTATHTHTTSAHQATSLSSCRSTITIGTVDVLRLAALVQNGGEGVG